MPNEFGCGCVGLEVLGYVASAVWWIFMNGLASQRR